MRSHVAARVLAALTLLAPLVAAQTLYGVDGGTSSLWEFTPAQGGACPQPNPLAVPCSYTSATCGVVPLAPFVAPPSGILGDVATNRLADTVFITDGFSIQEYLGDTACGTTPPCPTINSFRPPTSLGLGPLTGMGMDAAGTFTSGLPTLWVTDGRAIAGLVPGPCSATAAFPPCFPPLPPGRLLTDVSWNTGTAFGPGWWACDDSGFVYHIAFPACTVSTVFTPSNCGLSAPLTGIAFDVTTPNCVTGQGDSLYVTDGFGVEYLDVTTLLPAASFQTPVACSPTPAPMAGLALALHAIDYGTPRSLMTVSSFGQSSSPGPTFGIEVHDPPTGDNIWMILNFNTSSPGAFCPSVSGAGTQFWVNPAPPGLVTNLGPMGPGCNALPFPVPPSICSGLQLYFQFVALPTSGPRASDATQGLAVTIGAP